MYAEANLKQKVNKGNWILWQDGYLDFQTFFDFYPKFQKQNFLETTVQLYYPKPSTNFQKTCIISV